MPVLSKCACGAAAVTDISGEDVRIKCSVCGRSSEPKKTANEARKAWNTEGGR